MTTSNIALSQLAMSDKNVRVVAPDKAAHKRLMASIVSQGILQNLVVVSADRDHFIIINHHLHYLVTDNTIQEHSH